MTLTLASAVVFGEAVTLGYTVPATQPLRNLAELDAPGFADREVANETPDVTAPVLESAAVNGASLVLTYDEALDEGSVPAAGAFAVTVAGASRALAASDPVSVSGKTVTLTLSSAVVFGEAVTLGYTVPTGAGAQPLRNLAGLDAPGFAGREVANETPDVTAPVLESAAVNGASLVLTYDEALDEGSVPAAGAFAVTVAGASRALAASDPVSVSGKTVTLTLASAVVFGEAVMLSYTVPAAQPLRNLAELDAPGFADREVANETPDVTAPVLESAAVNGAGDTVTLYFDTTIDDDPVAPKSAFTVRADTVTIEIGTVQADGANRQVRLTGLSSLVREGQSITVAYEDPSENDDGAAIQDTAGNDAASFTTGEGGAPSITNGSTAPAMAPGAPENLVAAGSGDGAIALTWGTPADNGGRVVTSYRIEVSEDGSEASFTTLVPNHDAMTDGAIERRYEHTGLPIGAVRHYRVSATNDEGTGMPSKVDDATAVHPDAPDPPERARRCGGPPIAARRHDAGCALVDEARARRRIARHGFGRRIESTWRAGWDAERRLGDLIEHAVVETGCAFAHDVKEALGGSGNIDHVVMTPAGVWAVETKAHWLKSRRFPAGLAQAANNARRVRRHLKTPLPVRAALVIAERVDGPFERDHDWEGEPVKVFDATTFWRVLREERRQGRAVERFADTERIERMVWDLGSSRHLQT